MKKGFAFLLTLSLLCAAIPGQAWIYLPTSIWEIEGLPINPRITYFATLRAKPDDETKITTVQLSQPVDELYANWLGHGEQPLLLEVDDELRAEYSVADHKYQVGAAYTAEYDRIVNWSSRVSVPFGADEAQIQKARTDASQYLNAYCTCVTVERPHWEVRRVNKDGTQCVMTSYDQDFPVQYIDVPKDAILVPVNGIAYAWHQEFLSSDGGPNEAYLTMQNDWNVVYDRTGNIKYFYRIMEDTEYFGLGLATAIVRYELLNGDWHCREVTEMYEDGTAITAYFSKTGNGKLVNAVGYGLTDAIWPAWKE